MLCSGESTSTTVTVSDVSHRPKTMVENQMTSSGILNSHDLVRGMRSVSFGAPALSA